MTKQEKQLLLIDICARIPYKTIVKCRIIDFNTEEYAHDNSRKNTRHPEYTGNGYLFLVDVLSNRVQIRPIIENMEYVEASYFESMCNKGYASIDDCKPYLRPMSSMTKDEKEEERKLWNIITTTRNDLHYLYTDFFLSHHLDFRGLIPMGLALEAPEGMYE